MDNSEPVGRESFWTRNALSLACFAAFAVIFVAQSLLVGEAPSLMRCSIMSRSFGFWTYLTTGHFAEATFENWESEFLQMARSCC